VELERTVLQQETIVIKTGIHTSKNADALGISESKSKGIVKMLRLFYLYPVTDSI
jgi:hypothetical protein